MLVPQERTPASSVARCSHSYCLWKYSSLHSLRMAFCPELGHLQKGVSLGSQQVTWCQVVAPTLWLFFCHWMHRCHGGKGGEQYLVFVLDCGLVELQSMKSHPPLWLPAMISNPSGIRKVLRSPGVAWLSSPCSLSSSLNRSV